MNLHGVITALVTPFKGNKIDYSSLKKNLIFQCINNIKNILIAGSSGELYSLCYSTIINIVRFIKYHFKFFNIIICNESLNLTKCIYFYNILYNLNIDFVLQLIPNYILPSQRSIYNFFKNLSIYSTIKIIIYNIPKRTVVSIEKRTLELIYRISSIYGIKNSSNNVNYCLNIIKITKSLNKRYYHGDDLISCVLNFHKCDGVFSVLSNLFPQVIKRIYSSFGCSLLVKKFDKISLYFNSSDNPASIKWILYKLGFLKKNISFPLLFPCLYIKFAIVFLYNKFLNELLYNPLL